MKEQAKTPVFQEDNGTWAHLTKLVNPLICTIEYGRRTGFSSREEAEESYQHSLVSYHDQLSKLKGPGYAFYLFGISGLLAE